MLLLPVISLGAPPLVFGGDSTSRPVTQRSDQLAAPVREPLARFGAEPPAKTRPSVTGELHPPDFESSAFGLRPKGLLRLLPSGLRRRLFEWAWRVMTREELPASRAREVAVHELGHIIGDAASGQRNVGLMLKRFGDADGAIYRPAHQSPQTYEEILRGIVTMVSGWAFSQHFSRASGGDDDQQLMDGTTYRQILQSTSDVNSILSLLSSAKSKRFLDVDPADLAPLNQRGMVEIMRPLNHGVETEFTPLATQLADIVSQSYQTFRLPVVSRAILTSKLLFGTIPPEAFQAMVGEAVARRVISPEEMPAFLDRHLTPEVQQRLTGIMDAYVADAMQRFMPIKPD